MKSLRFTKVLFAADTNDVVKALIKPTDWPSMEMKVDMLVTELKSSPEWSVMYYEETLANKGAYAIAQSVIKDGRTQSYVAQGYPRWLEVVFEYERSNG